MEKAQYNTNEVVNVRAVWTLCESQYGHYL